MTVTGVRRAGERAVVLDADDEPADLAASARGLLPPRVSRWWRWSPARPPCSWSPEAAALTRLLGALPRLAEGSAAPRPDTVDLIELPIRYDGPDLGAVAAATGLEISDVVRLHSAVTYRAAFTGFAPGFAYLTGLDPALRVPRRPTPRPAVPPGSVAIADTYTAVYPRASPGGWSLIGTTDTVIFDPAGISGTHCPGCTSAFPAA